MFIYRFLLWRGGTRLICIMEAEDGVNMIA